MGVCRFAFLPVELCGAHYLSIEQLSALKYLPCLLYRVEVRLPGPCWGRAKCLMLENAALTSFRRHCLCP